MNDAGKVRYSAAVLFALVALVGFFLFHEKAIAPVIEFPSDTFVQAHLDEMVYQQGITLLPTRVIEDSRCPLDVRCVWAGTVRVQTRGAHDMSTSTMVLEFGQSIITDSAEITLVEVQPEPKADSAPAPSDYVFIFEIQKR